MKYTYASIVPLIGGETIGMQNAFGTRPEYVLSYEAFQANDSQLLNYYNNEVPYRLLDKANDPVEKVDVINSTCPCAGLSSLSPHASSTNKMNDWMIETAKHVLGKVKPKIFWGENAPRLASKMGEPVVAILREIAEKEGYVFSLYKTKSLLHGLSQVRDRSFYFFWKGDSIPLLPYFRREHEKIEDTIRNSKRRKSDPMNVLVNDKTPSKDPYYRYILEEIHGGISHKEFQELLPKSITTLEYIEEQGITYDKVKEWMLENNYLAHADKCQRMYEKLAAGGNIMRKQTTIPKDYIGAFVGHMPTLLTHPDEDRYLTIRECLDIMKMPADFELLGGRKNLNMICQNVPVTTSTDMAKSVYEVLEGNYDRITANFLIQSNHTQSHEVEIEPSTLESFIK